MGKEQEGREQSQGRDRLVGEEAWGTFRSHGPHGFGADAVMVRTDPQGSGGRAAIRKFMHLLLMVLWYHVSAGTY